MLLCSKIFCSEKFSFPVFGYLEFRSQSLEGLDPDVKIWKIQSFDLEGLEFLSLKQSFGPMF